ncbi:MAG: hypothetical protein ACJ763_17890 [Bdellovibrionia bacterium]
MSTNNRIGRNPFDKKPKASIPAAQSPASTQTVKTGQPQKTAKSKKSVKTSETVQPEFVLKVSDKKTETAKKIESFQNLETSDQLSAKTAESEAQIIGELIDLPEESWQPLTAVPSQFIKQLLSRWI